MNFKSLSFTPVLSVFLLSILFLSSCDNTEEKEIQLITEEDAVEVVESALMYGSEGISDEAKDASEVAKDYSEAASISSCGESFDSTLIKEIERPKIRAFYSTSWAWMISCNDFFIPEALSFGRTATGTYETSRFIGDSQSSSTWGLDSLILGGSWNLVGSYNRSGTHQSKVRNQNALSFELEIEMASLEVDKGDLEIRSGTGTFSLLLSDGNDNSTSLEGSITFLGDGMATIIINGNTYEIELD